MRLLVLTMFVVLGAIISSFHAIAALSEPKSRLVYLDSLPPGMKYRQLKALDYIGKGFECDDLSAIGAGIGSANSEIDTSNEDMQRTEMRIIDPSTVASAGVQMLTISAALRQEVADSIEQIEMQHGDLISLIDETELIEEAIMVRSDLLDAFERVGVNWIDANGLSGFSIDDFQAGTLALQDDYEMIFFERQVGDLTTATIGNLKGALAALQRQVESGMDMKAVRQGRLTFGRMSEENEAQYNEVRRMRTQWYFNNVYLPMLRGTAGGGSAFVNF